MLRARPAQNRADSIGRDWSRSRPEKQNPSAKKPHRDSAEKPHREPCFPVRKNRTTGKVPIPHYYLYLGCVPTSRKDAREARFHSAVASGHPWLGVFGLPKKSGSGVFEVKRDRATPAPFDGRLFWPPGSSWAGPRKSEATSLHFFRRRMQCPPIIVDVACVYDAVGTLPVISPAFSRGPSFSNPGVKTGRIVRACNCPGRTFRRSVGVRNTSHSPFPAVLLPLRDGWSSTGMAGNAHVAGPAVSWRYITARCAKVTFWRSLAGLLH